MVDYIMYGILADIVVVVHLFWILFLITGAYWGRTYRAVMFAHGGGLIFAVMLSVFDWYCPLTHLEVWLRAQQGREDVYAGSFIAHYAEKFIYFPVAGRTIFILTLVLVAANAWLYSGVFRGRTRP